MSVCESLTSTEDGLWTFAIFPRSARTPLVSTCQQKKGLSVPIQLLPALIEGLQEAETRLSGKGDDALPEPGEELWQAKFGQRFSELMRDMD